MSYNVGRSVTLPPEIGNISNVSLTFPAKPQTATLDFTLDIELLLTAEGSTCSGAFVELLGPDQQVFPIEVAQQPVPSKDLTVYISGGDLYVAYAVRFNFTTSVPGEMDRQYCIDVWMFVANVASYSGDWSVYLGTNTGYPTGVGPRGSAGSGVSSAAPNTGLVINGTQITLNAGNLPTSPEGLPSGAPWNNNNVLSFAP